MFCDFVINVLRVDSPQMWAFLCSGIGVLGKRSLQRRLSEEGQTFKDVLQQTRRDLAVHYLSYERLSLAEISFLLGFADANSFIRAYSDWEGISPGKFRQTV